MPNLIQIPMAVNSFPVESDGFARMAFNLTQIDADNSEIEIYDVISSKKSVRWNSKEQKYEDGTEVTPNDFKEQLKNCSTKNITIRMNSRGGDVNSANVISVAIQEARKSGKKFSCKIDGLCASAAVQIAVSCDEVIIHKSALIMIHNPMCFLFGYYNTNELTSVFNMLDAVKNSIMNYYIDKTGLSKDKLSAMMDDETWMDGKEAVEKGFADKLMFSEDDDDAKNVIDRVKNCIDSASFMNIPEMYKSQNTQKGEPEEMPINTVEELIAQYPDFVNQIKESAINESNSSAVEQERERIKAIDELSGKVDNELLNKAKYETFATAQDVAMEAIKTGAFVQNTVLNALANEGKATDGVKALGNDGNKTEAQIAQEQKTETKNQAEKVALDHLKKLGKVE